MPAPEPPIRRSTADRPTPTRSAAADATAVKPYVPDEAKLAEFTWPAVVVGAILGVIFGASSLYLTLKVGLTVSASIPIAVLSITLFRLFSRILGTRKATILENNMVQTVGSAGESIAFGVGVTMPALMILGYEMDIARVIVVASLGGLLGILMMIPLRRAFIVKQHGVLPYPEGTACADVLIVGEEGGSTAKTVFFGFGVATLYKFLMSAMKLWKDTPERAFKFFPGASVGSDVSPELLGVGYIIGTKISCIMVAGGVLASWVLTPMIKLFGDHLNEAVFPATKLIRDMDPDDVWHAYVLYIGAGAVGAGGIISMFQSLPLIIKSLRSGLADLAGGKGSGRGGARRRTENDLPLWVVLVGSLGLVAAIAAAPMLGLGFTLRGLVGAVLIVLFGFLFVTVSSRLTGQIGSSSNPISGMTVATLLLTCLVFILMNQFDPGGGWIGKGARLTALSIAAIVCIAASNGGTTSQDLKTGFLVGATPRYQQLGLFVGALTSALVIGATLLLLNNASTVYAQRNYPVIAPVAELTDREQPSGPDVASDKNSYHVWQVDSGSVAYRDSQGRTQYVPQGKYLVDDSGRIHYLVDPGINGEVNKRIVDGREQTVLKYKAPKAQLMSLIIDGILTQKLPWSLVLLGVSIAIVLEFCGVPSLPFAVGVYLPMSASVPIFIGGLVRWFVDKVNHKPPAESEMSPGVLLSSGYIAGGAIAGILAALLTLVPFVSEKLDFSERVGEMAQSNWVPLIPFGILIILLALVGAEVLLKAKRSPARRSSAESED